MSGDRKRKLGGSENEEHMMTLLKRLHLERTSELYERAPQSGTRSETRSSARGNTLSEASHCTARGEAVGSKRWRLSPIMEEVEEGVAKRRRIDSEMADSLLNNLWISDKRDAADEGDSITAPSSAQPAADALPSTSVLPSAIESVKVVGLSGRPATLEEKFIKEQLREQHLQLVLWSPPLTVETIVQNSLHTQSTRDCFNNEEGDPEYMC